MPVFLVTLIILLISLAIFSYHSRREKNKKDLYPFRKELLMELIHDLKTRKIDIILSKEGPADSSLSLTLFEAKNFFDNKRELAREEYDDFKLFFTDNYSNILDFRKYVGNKFLPAEVLEDLKSFYNTSYTKADPEGLYFIVITENSVDNNFTEEISYELLSGDAPAFKSWLSFKQNAHNLNFVICQWIRENGDANDTVLFEELEYIET
jgi:hypothetical protein